VPRRVDHVEHERLAGPLPLADLPRHPHGLALDRDAAFALDVHAVEVLRAHLPGVHDLRELQHPVGQRALAVVDVGDDAEVAQALRRRGSGPDTRVGRRWHGRPFL
jgi:hypothetical protein